MPRIPAHSLDSAPEATRPTLEALQRKTGKLLNIHAGMAHAPVVVAVYAGMQAALAEHGTFDARAREAIALAVGAVDGCSYCQSAHTLSGKAAGLSAGDMIDIRAGRPVVDARLDTLLGVAREAVGDTGYVQEPTWQAALDAGWTDVQLAEAFAHVAVNLYTNYFNHYAGTELDVPQAPPLAG